mgnify:CR=1 FL=1
MLLNRINIYQNESLKQLKKLQTTCKNDFRSKLRLIVLAPSQMLKAQFPEMSIKPIAFID